MTLVDLARRNARSQPGRVAYRYLQSGEVDGPAEELTYAELERRARAVGAWLQERSAAGQRALLLYPPGLDFMSAFLGCLYAGAIAVPAYSPDPARLNRSLPRLRTIAADSRARFVLTTGSLRKRSRSLLPRIPELGKLRWVATDSLEEELAAAWRPGAAASEDAALLQYTSGSTGQPKGIVVSHRNLHHNMHLLATACGLDAGSDLVCWMPVAHDMGLIMHVLETLYLGSTCTVMSPMSFVQRPLRWLEAISRFRACISGGPNFGYELCVRKVSDQDRRALDLGTWSVAWNAAEPVRAATLERFSNAFAPCGFRPEAFYPCWGLAESTVFVSGGRREAPPCIAVVDPRALADRRWVRAPASDPRGQPVVGCGRAWLDQEILIVDPETRRRCAVDRVGEIWVRSPSLPQGYWNRPRETAEVFGVHLESGEGPYLRTGDLGVIDEGELYFAGRLKDLIILAGLNHYPQDVEQTVVDSHPSLRPGCCAAFAVEFDGEERLAVAAEVDLERGRAPATLEDVVAAVRRAVAEEHAVPLHALALLEPRTIPKTNSGKIQRRACSEAFLAGRLTAVHLSLKTSSAPAARGPEGRIPPIPGPGSQPTASRSRIRAVESWLIARLAERLGLTPEAIDAEKPFEHYGLGSRQLVELAGDLAAHFAGELPPTLLYDYPTIAKVARRVAAGERPTPAPGARATEGEREPIAVLGLGCRFPGGVEIPEDFWRLLCDGADAVTEVPPARWDPTAVSDTPEARWGGFLHRFEGFDAPLFGIAPREAETMDPRQGLLLEVAWQALENAGLPAAALSEQAVGVFVGISGHSLETAADSAGDLNAYSATGSTLSVAAGRLSYVLGLSGPSLAVDTACSSSLVAVHLACQSLHAGECEVALAGGVNLIPSPRMSVALARTGTLAVDGRCKSFADAADGYVRGEGCGLVVLARQRAAAAIDRRALALIRGTAINHDGPSNGLTAPSGRAQEAVIRRALEQAGVAPEEVDVVEAHGSGTALGDPIELRALGAVYGRGRAADRPLRIGSVKTNIGHLEPAAGVASLIKLVLALGHGELPPSLHFTEPNRHVPWHELPLTVTAARGPWPAGASQRIAAVSSFGFSGTNAHLVLSEAEEEEPARAREAQSVERPEHLLALSAASDESLRRLAARYARRLAESDAPLFSDICFSAACGRSHLEHRLALRAADADAARSALADFAAGRSAPKLTSGRRRRRPKIAFLFTGQGASYPDMGRELYTTQPVFRRVIDHCRQRLPEAAERPRQVGWEELCAADDQRLAQPALFALEIALAELWRSWGVVPDVVLGHSLGEIAAACVAGIFDVADGLRLVAERGRLVDGLDGSGRMSSVLASAERVAAAASDAVAIAAFNGPEQVAISGAAGAVETTLARLEADGVESWPLEVPRPLHSPLVEPILEAFEEAVSKVRRSPPRIPLVTNLSGALAGEEVLSPSYWRRQMREPVRFADSMATLAGEGIDVFIEIGPHPTLLGMGAACLGAGAALWLPSLWGDGLGNRLFPLRRKEGPWSVMLDSLARLYVRGAAIDWRGFDRPYRRRWEALPTYPFARPRSGGPETRSATSELAERDPAVARPAAAAEDGIEAILERQLQAFNRLVDQQLKVLEQADPGSGFS